MMEINYIFMRGVLKLSWFQNLFADDFWPLLQMKLMVVKIHPLWEIAPELVFGFILAALWCYSITSRQDSTIFNILKIACGILVCYYIFETNEVRELDISASLALNGVYVILCKIVLTILFLAVLCRSGLTTQHALYAGAVLLFGLSLISSIDILIFYISLEGLSLLTYGLVATNKSIGSAEAGLKYFINGAIASVLLIFGLSILYLQSQSIQWIDIYWIGFSNQVYSWINLIAMLLIFSSLLYKLSVFPFHLALPDVYEGSHWFTVAIINFGVKAAVIFMFFRLWGLFNMYVELERVMWVIAVLASLSIIIGCFGALTQTSLRRFLAYTSINQAGFLLIGLLTGTVAGLQAALLYTVVYLLSLVLFIAVVIEGGVKSDNILDIRHISRPYRIGFTVALFSMAGVPPMLGFVSKYVVWLSLFDVVLSTTNSISGWVLGLTLAVSILTSLVSAFYYIRLIRLISFRVSSTESQLLDFTTLITGVGLIAWPVFIVEIFSITHSWALYNYGSWIDFLL